MFTKERQAKTNRKAGRQGKAEGKRGFQGGVVSRDEPTGGGISDNNSSHLVGVLCVPVTVLRLEVD